MTDKEYTFPILSLFIGATLIVGCVCLIFHGYYNQEKYYYSRLEYFKCEARLDFEIEKAKITQRYEAKN